MKTAQGLCAKESKPIQEASVKTFADLEFKPHSIGNGLQARMDFENGYGVSVVRFMIMFGGGYGSYTDNESQWELAIFKNGHICYDSGITDDVMGRLSADEVTDIMRQAQELQP